MLRLHPCSTAARKYHSSVDPSLIRSRRTMWWPHGNCAAICRAIDSSGHSPANRRMYFRLRGLKSSTPGNSVPRSLANRSMTLVPQTSGLLPIQNVSPDGPIQQTEFSADRKCCAHLGVADTRLDLSEEVSIVGRGLKRFGHRSSGIWHLRSLRGRGGVGRAFADKGKGKSSWSPTAQPGAPLGKSLSHLCRKYRRSSRFYRLSRLVSPLPSVF